MIVGAYIRLWLCSVGNTAVEFAFVITPLLLLIFGTTELGRYFWIRNAIETTAINSVRCISVQGYNFTENEDSSNCLNSANVLRNKSIVFDGEAVNSDVIIVTDIDSGEECGSPTDPDDYGFITLQYEYRALFIPVPKRTISVSACFPIQGE